MDDLREWYGCVLLTLVLLRRIARTQFTRHELPIKGWIRCGVQSVCYLLQAYVVQLEKQMNTLALMNPHSHCKGEQMTTETRSEQASQNRSHEMLEEFLLELNPSDAHITVRCNTLALAQEYCQRLFPKSYVKAGPSPDIHVVQFAEGETNHNEALGIIQRITVPNKWVMNRRLQDEGKKRTERAA